MSAPISFTTGPFAGWTVRGELKELQKADMGRKYVDKAPFQGIPDYKYDQVWTKGSQASRPAPCSPTTVLPRVQQWDRTTVGA